MSDREKIEFSASERHADVYDAWSQERGVETSRAYWKRRALAAEAEAFALAAQTCHEPVVGEHGDMLCGRLQRAAVHGAEDERDRLLDEAINMVCSSRDDVRSQGKHAIDFLRSEGAMPASERSAIRNDQRLKEPRP